MDTRSAFTVAVIGLTGLILVSCSDERSDRRKAVSAYPEREATAPAGWPAIGDKVVTRTYGVATVVRSTSRSVRVRTNSGSEIDIRRTELGDSLRKLMTKKQASEVLTLLRAQEVAPDDRPWETRYAEYVKSLRTAGPIDRARLLRTLYASPKPLEMGERKLADLLENELFEELALVAEVERGTLEAELYQRFPNAAPQSRRDPMVGDCFLRMCYRSIETDGPLPARNAWLGIMRNGSRAAACVAPDVERVIDLSAVITAKGRLEVKSVRGGEGDENACISGGLGKARLLGMPGDASGPTDVHLVFQLRKR